MLGTSATATVAAAIRSVASLRAAVTIGSVATAEARLRRSIAVSLAVERGLVSGAAARGSHATASTGPLATLPSLGKQVLGHLRLVKILVLVAGATVGTSRRC
jgi:hypothetical protein